jgi:hypothetical protein
MHREKTQNIKPRNEKGEIPKKKPQKFRESSETSLRIYISKNWKILRKWTNFQIITTIQN